MEEVIQPFVQFGVAGLMGLLWVWERLYSRRRELQLDQAHQRLAEQREQLDVLAQLIRQNTAAIERFDCTQLRLIQLLETMQQALRRQVA